MGALEDRVRDLEVFRFKMLGRVNAHERLIINLWMNIIDKAADPVAVADALRRGLLAGVDEPTSFPGADPVHLDLISQEYREALQQVLDHLVMLAQGAASRAGRPHKD